MRRSPRVLLAWAAAVVVMLLTAQVVAGDLGALHRRARSLGPDIPVLLAARDLALGSTVSIEDLRVVHRPATTVAPDALRDPARAIGRVVSVALLRDDVIGARHLVSRAGGIVPDGSRAVHVVVKDGYRPPTGSVVDVLATYDPEVAAGAGAPGMATVVARGARVLTAAPDASDTTDTPGAGVTLLVTEAEGRAVVYAASAGDVALAVAPAQSACCSAPTP